jgi:tetratricopeptide (TPR) repeat protein
MPKIVPRALLLLAGSLLLAGCSSHPATDASYDRFMRLANDLDNRGDPVTAAAFYEQAAAQPGAGVDAWLALGQVRLKSGDARGAERAFQQALELKPESADALLGLGTAQLRLGKLERAVVVLTRAGALFDLPAAYNRLGIAQILLGQAGEAQASFKKSLSLTPDDLDTQSNLALACALGGQSQQALDDIHSVSQSPRAQPRHQRNELLVMVLANREQDVMTAQMDDITPIERQQLLIEARRIKAITDPRRQAQELGLIDSR